MAEEPEVVIRHLREKDLRAIEWDGEYAHYRRIYARAFREARRGHQILYIAEYGSAIIGQIFIQLNGVQSDPQPQPYTAYLYSFRVKPQYRNMGGGSALIRMAERELSDRSYHRILIGVAKHNSLARRLYERHGYHIIGEDPGRWSYLDHKNRIQHVVEPTFILEKIIRQNS